MTLFGPDISNVNFGGEDNPDLDAAAAFVKLLPGQGFSFLLAKASQGSDFVDPVFQTIAAANTLPLVGYHFVDDTNPTTQAANYVRALGGVKAACMLDFEYEDENNHPILTPADYWNVVNAFNAQNIEVHLSYYPHWYWEDIGQPDLSQVPGLISSAYPLSCSGLADALYSGAGRDNGEGWNTYGGAQPVLWQYTNKATIGAIKVDCNAFRGQLGGLQTLLSTNS